jgi:hypothetical protein
MICVSIQSLDFYKLSVADTVTEMWGLAGITRVTANSNWCLESKLIWFLWWVYCTKPNIVTCKLLLLGWCLWIGILIVLATALAYTLNASWSWPKIGNNIEFRGMASTCSLLNTRWNQQELCYNSLMCVEMSYPTIA